MRRSALLIGVAGLVIAALLLAAYSQLIVTRHAGVRIVDELHYERQNLKELSGCHLVEHLPVDNLLLISHYMCAGNASKIVVEPPPPDVGRLTIYIYEYVGVVNAVKWSVVGGDVYVSLANGTRVKAVKTIAVGVRVEHGGVIVFKSGPCLTQLITRLSLDESSPRIHGLTFVGLCIARADLS